jgi:hypothetical protein
MKNEELKIKKLMINRSKLIVPLLIAFAFCIFNFSFTSCGIYGFNDISIPDSIKTVRIQFIENKARIVNPQLSPRLTERLRLKVVNQTRLTQTNNDNADYDIYGEISDYSVTTSGVSGPNGQQQASLNRLTVSVRIFKRDQKSNAEPVEYTISRSFDFSANTPLQQAENTLLDDMVRTLTDEIFNRIFSNW